MDFLEFISGLSLHGSNRQKRVVFYSIDSLFHSPFVYFTGIQRGETLDAFPMFETKEDIEIKGMTMKGIHPFKGTDYHFYEIPVVHNLERPTKQCKITPYEILYIRHVDGIPIDPTSLFFLKSHSFLCILRDGEEHKVPGSFYLSIPKIRVKEQLFLPSITEGIFKKGYYLYTYERCLELPKEHLITIPNSIQLQGKEKVTLRKGHAYINSHDMGPIDVTPHTTLTISHVTPQWITLKTSLPHANEEEWCTLRYFCNMDNHWTGPRSKEGYDSFSYDQTFKTLNPDRVRCVSITNTSRE
jgi:hypothetical protein